MEGKTMRRANRSARAIMHGPKILDFILEKKTQKQLVAAANSGAPPVTAISDQLIKLIGMKDAKLSPVKQFVGVCIRAALEQHGYRVAEKGVRVSNDPVFRSGSTYEPLAKMTAPTLLERIAGCLTDEEAREFLKLLGRRRGG